ncbi:MAG TPA: hypothetical protein VFU47_05415, partial [Armatimonadota bacterium]|nr:hypothetical protein [Armatimonadota bacterium]
MTRMCLLAAMIWLAAGGREVSLIEEVRPPAYLVSASGARTRLGPESAGLVLLAGQRVVCEGPGVVRLHAGGKVVRVDRAHPYRAASG